MADITIVTGVYKPTYNWGAPSCTTFIDLGGPKIVFYFFFALFACNIGHPLHIAALLTQILVDLGDFFITHIERNRVLNQPQKKGMAPDRF